MRRQVVSVRRLDEEGTVLCIERVQPAQIVEEPRSRGAAIVVRVQIVASGAVLHKGMVGEGSSRSDQRVQFEKSWS